MIYPDNIHRLAGIIAACGEPNAHENAPRMSQNQLRILCQYLRENASAARAAADNINGIYEKSAREQRAEIFAELANSLEEMEISAPRK